MAGKKVRFVAKRVRFDGAARDVSQPFQAMSLVLLLVWVAGCDVPPRPPIDPSDVRVEETDLAVTVDPEKQEILDAPGESFAGNWETWEAFFVGDKQVGFSHILAESVNDKSASDTRHVVENVMFMNQGRSRLLQHLQQTSLETFDGRLIEFEGTLQVGPAVTQLNGSVADGVLEIETVRGSSRSVRKVPWQSTYRGLVALKQSLKTKPMQNKGETRTLKLLVPGSYHLATARLRCSGRAAVPLIDGKIAELIEIESEIRFDQGRPSFSTIWTDESGVIVRTYSPRLHLVSYRTDQASATEFDGNALQANVIAVSGKIDRPSETKRVAWKVVATPQSVRKKAALNLIAIPGQFVRTSENNHEILVSRRSESLAKGFVAASLVPSADDRKANYFVDFTSILVQRFADAAVGSARLSQREVAVELARTAHSLVETDDQSGGLFKASEVANLGKGDCTGQAIFLAALLRARRIPSQVVFGLKYDAGDRNQMIYHAWTMAYVDKQWLHLDATSGDVAAADRLGLAISNLSGGNEYEALVPYLDAVGRMEITVLGAQY